MNESSVRCNGRSMEGSRRLIHAAAEALSTLPAGAFTSHAPQPRLPRVATTRATSFRSFTHGFVTNVASVPEHTHKKRTLRSPRKMMPMLVTNKLLYNEAGARCIWPSLSRGLTLTAEASTSHEPQQRPQPFALPVHALDPFGIVIVVRNIDPRQLVGDKFSQPRRAPKLIASRIGQASARIRCACHRQQKIRLSKGAAHVNQTKGCDAFGETQIESFASSKPGTLLGGQFQCGGNLRQAWAHATAKIHYYASFSTS